MRYLIKQASYSLLVVAALTVTTHAAAQDKVVFKEPLRIVVPFSSGALIDIIARIYAEKMSPILGQPVIVENKPGGGGLVGAQRVLAEPIDRNVMLFVSSSYAVIPSVNEKMPYNTLKDFSGITFIASSPTLLVINGKSSINNLRELIDKAKESGSHMNYGSAGVNSATDLVGRYFNQETGAKLEHIPYKGVQEGVSETVAGRIDASFPPIALALPFIQSGQLKALAVTSPKRSGLLPNVPTVSEEGIAEFDYSIWYGVVMNSKTPDAVKTAISNAIVKINSDPEVLEKLSKQGLVPETKVLGEFDRYITKEMEKFGKILKSGN